MLINKAFDFMEECLGADNSGHDVEHINRVVKNAERILEFEKDADKDVVLLSAILHDVDDYKLGGNGENLERFFSENDVDENLRTKISDVIENISFSKSGEKPEFSSLEQKIVSDADKLDAMGAIGICRTIMYSAKTKRKLFDDNEFPSENLSKEEYKNKDRKNNHSINHFFDKLLKLKGAMQTNEGKVEAEKRHRFMVMFLREFFDEVDASQNWGEILSKFDKK
ncbi:MAG: HD domain-containing protein [Alphaproteobacteria bacterium]|nr:HD domain-containing protein [Alphaproteobacteria bacterium]